jgi:Cdc6-like AAA superfamily ATPase
MITDARALREEFLPGEVLHRNAELGEIATALAPLEGGESGETCFLFGPSGAGKTVCARFAARRLAAECPSIETAYVNCWQHTSRFSVAYDLLDDVGRSADVHRRSTPTDVVLDRLTAAVDDLVVAVVDEVDQLEATELLYDLHAVSDLTLVLIANREAELFRDLENRTRSRIRAGIRIQFDRYDPDALVAILADRAAQALVPDAAPRPVLEHVADRAAGDARDAINVLRTAARIAEDRGATALTTALVDEAVPDARRAQREETRERLTDHQRAVYDVVAEDAPVAPGALYEAYAARVDDPRTQRTVRTYLSKLVQYDLLEATGQKRDRRYALAGERSP